jgi:hypothetical protein
VGGQLQRLPKSEGSTRPGWGGGGGEAPRAVLGWESQASPLQNKYLLALYTRILLSSSYLHCKCFLNSKAVMCTWNLSFVWGHYIRRGCEKWVLEKKVIPLKAKLNQCLQHTSLCQDRYLKGHPKMNPNWVRPLSLSLGMLSGPGAVKPLLPVQAVSERSKWQPCHGSGTRVPSASWGFLLRGPLAPASQASNSTAILGRKRTEFPAH